MTKSPSRKTEADPVITITTPPKAKARAKKKVKSQSQTMAELQQIAGGEVTDMIEAEELPISKDLDWAEVSAIGIFNSHKFSPVEELIQQYQQIKLIYNTELKKDKPSARILSDLQNTLLKINQTLLPYRYSKVELVKLDNPVRPSITVRLENIDIVDSSTEVTEIKDNGEVIELPFDTKE